MPAWLRQRSGSRHNDGRFRTGAVELRGHLDRGGHRSSLDPHETESREIIARGGREQENLRYAQRFSLLEDTLDQAGADPRRTPFRRDNRGSEQRIFAIQLDTDGAGNYPLAFRYDESFEAFAHARRRKIVLS